MISWWGSPDERSLGVANEAEQHQKADEDVKQKQDYVAQPPVKIQVITNGCMSLGKTNKPLDKQD